jgi:hypothetical protein
VGRSLPQRSTPWSASLARAAEEAGREHRSAIARNVA